MAYTPLGESRSIESAVLRGFLYGTISGTIIVFLLWGGVALIGGMSDASAIALYTAAWGGPGFGGMLGAVMGYVRYEEGPNGTHFGAPH